MTMPRIMVFMLIFALAACGGRRDDVTLTRIKKTGDGPDEFTILPGKPLQTPETFKSLPAPTPGGSNLTDQNPIADGIAALGGNPGALNNTGVSPSDASLVNHAGRYGVTPGIRQALAVEDATIRRKHGRVNILRIGPLDDYTTAYKRQWLDAFSEERRLRRLGIATPSAPPEQN